MGGGVSLGVLPGASRFSSRSWAFVSWRLVMSSCRHVVLLVVSCGLLVHASRGVLLRGGAVCGGGTFVCSLCRLVVMLLSLSSVLSVSLLSSSSGWTVRDVCVGGLFCSSRGGGASPSWRRAVFLVWLCDPWGRGVLASVRVSRGVSVVAAGAAGGAHPSRRGS